MANLNKRMQRKKTSIILLLGLLTSLLTLVPHSINAQTPVQTATPPGAIPTASPEGTQENLQTALPTETLTIEPTVSPTNTSPPDEEAYQRPLIVLHSYSPSDIDIVPGKQFTIEISLINKGQLPATNIVAAVTGGNFLAGETGGVIAVGNLAPGDKRKFTQPLTTAIDIWSNYFVTLDITVNYTDPTGVAYQEVFVISYPVDWGSVIVATNTPATTATPTPFLRPQLVITSYRISADQLQPGGQFALELGLQNLGQTTARQVTMILGGGGLAGNGASETAQPPGGISGGSADLTNFAPLGSSNIQSLGDLAAGASATASQDLIVNVSTDPGAYPLKVTFTYLDDNNQVFTDDQVITLLVFSPPQVEISFYRDPGILFAGQPNALPIQIVNIGRSSVVLGNMTVSSEAELSNNVILVGALESGGYFTMDATVIPFQPGTLSLDILVRFTDDFNQPQQINQALTVEVGEAPIFEPEPGEPGSPEGPNGEGSFPPSGETLWGKVVRFFRGLIGLDSGLTEPGQPVFEEPVPTFEGPIIVPGKG